jgi:1-acyl-sn-glycerol-3-phosphate acyltransferase
VFIARDANVVYWAFQCVLWGFFRLLMNLHVTGIDNVPLSGPVIISPNHLHSLDIPIVGMCIRRRTTIMAADKWRGKLGGWAIERMTHTIYVARGEPDREALAESLKLLRAGGSLAVAPEGTRSRKPGLQEGHDGASYLASRTGATIVPVAVWGHEKAFSEWRRLRRPQVFVAFCEPIVLPPTAARARTDELHRYTEQIMLAMAEKMPAEYWGMYADRVPA